MVDDSSSATIAAARVGAQERIRAAALDSEGDSQHKVLLRIRAIGSLLPVLAPAGTRYGL